MTVTKHICYTNCDSILRIHACLQENLCLFWSKTLQQLTQQTLFLVMQFEAGDCGLLIHVT